MKVSESPKCPGRTRWPKYPILADILATPAVEEKEENSKAVNNLPVVAPGLANVKKCPLFIPIPNVDNETA